MPWFLADLITVTHFCPVYLSKIFIVFKAFKIPFVELFVAFLVFHQLIVLVETCHWLPVKQRIQFKNLLLTYKSLHTGLPSYLNSALVPFSSPFHSTIRRSPANLILSTMTCNSSRTSKSQLNYSFAYMAPRNWNSLPDTVRLAPSVPTLPKRLRTYLFWQAFSPP